MQCLLCLISWELNLIATGRQWPHVTAFDPLKWFKAHSKRIQFWNLSSFWNQKALSTLNIYTAVSQQSYHVHQTFGNLTSSINTHLPLVTEQDYNFWKYQISKFSKNGDFCKNDQFLETCSNQPFNSAEPLSVSGNIKNFLKSNKTHFSTFLIKYVFVTWFQVAESFRWWYM